MARLIDGIIGHQDIIQRFLSSLEKGQLPHAYLFVGPAGVGRKATALALAQAFLCEKSPKVCGVCGSCLRITSFVSHKVTKTSPTAGSGTESLLVIEPEKNQIRIDQAHQVLEFLNFKSVSKNRLVIINGADLLNPQSANALLKSIEEPPEGTYFFLIAPSPAHVLSTIRSRAQVVSFKPLTVAEMKKKASAPEWALKASQGSFERLAQLLEKDEQEIRESALVWLQDWAQEPQAYLRSEHRDLVRDREVARSLAHHLSWLLRDALYLKLGAQDKVLNSDKVSSLQKITAEISNEDLQRACEKALWIEQKLDANQDASLVFEQFWIETRP
jgi:DNA polymerase-3 subunit delta'